MAMRSPSRARRRSTNARAFEALEVFDRHELLSVNLVKRKKRRAVAGVQVLLTDGPRLHAEDIGDIRDREEAIGLATTVALLLLVARSPTVRWGKPVGHESQLDECAHMRIVC
jgi:hypothetical protein